ncbi:BH3 interacting domain death agonist [Brachyhypopomus gauderio]|uniref:BH3 interacting domain death agonist n=1 Tax=Brachyhypopomus gauderio TaxID=698409 RepID=UPI0040420AF5
MEVYESLDGFSPDCLSLMFLTFLHHRPCRSEELCRELAELDREVQTCLHVHYDCGGGGDDYDDDGLETDGHSTLTSLRSVQQDYFPQVQLGLPENAQEIEGVREVAAEIIRIADEINQSIISQAAERLTKKLRSSPQNNWKNHLSQGIDSLLQEVPGVQTEQAVMALSFSLVKAACEVAPRLLRGLYYALMQHVSFARPK